MMRRFILVILFSSFLLLASKNIAQGVPILNWSWCQKESSDVVGCCLSVSGLPSGEEIVFNQLTIENVHNVTNGSMVSNTSCIDFWDLWGNNNLLPLDLRYISAEDVTDALGNLPEAAKYDSFLLTSPLYHCTEITSLPVETNDGTNPGGFNLPGGRMTCGIGNINANFTVAPASGLMFAYVVDPGMNGELLGYGHERSYVTLDITVGEENYVWRHQPIGWIEPAIPCFQTDPADGKLNFGNVRIGTTVAKEVAIFPNENYSCYPWGVSLGKFGDFEKLSDSDFVYTPTDHGEDREWLGDEYSCELHHDEGWYEGFGSSVYFDCTGCGVGPVFESEIALGETIDFGEVAVDSFFDVFFEIGNVTPDEELGDLTCLSFRAEIVGDDAELFEIVGDSEGTLLVGESTSLQLRFNGQDLAQLGDYDADLVIYTDEGTEFGSTIMPQTFAMSAIAVPEPSMLMALFGLGMMSLLIRKDRRH